MIQNFVHIFTHETIDKSRPTVSRTKGGEGVKDILYKLLELMCDPILIEVVSLISIVFSTIALVVLAIK